MLAVIIWTFKISQDIKLSVDAAQNVMFHKAGLVARPVRTGVDKPKNDPYGPRSIAQEQVRCVVLHRSGTHQMCGKYVDDETLRQRP